MTKIRYRYVMVRLKVYREQVLFPVNGKFTVQENFLTYYVNVFNFPSSSKLKGCVEEVMLEKVRVVQTLAFGYN